MILTVILGLLGLGVIVFIHELGHFAAARFCGVTVESFSIGWGPVLLRKKIGETEYRLSLVPIGGYCGMKGDKAFQQALEDKLTEIPREEGSFYGVSPFKRILIAFAGPFCNFLFAVLAFTVIAMVGYSYQSAGNRVLLASELYTGLSSAA
ncbi:MAG: site-2 protease family protein [Spirochaetaceae bacterium]|jgi:regulator of sigma E protease|nr:site-2 protease family protein [Spirochaetaceae bacterium]